MWTSKSWPEGIPRKKVGTKMAKAAIAMVSRGVPKTGSLVGGASRFLAGVSAARKDCCLISENGQTGFVSGF